MTNEEIIQEAYRRYPPGTQFVPVLVLKSAFTTSTIPNNNEYFVDIDSDNIIILRKKNTNEVIRDERSGYIQALGVVLKDYIIWAEIIKKPICYDI